MHELTEQIVLCLLQHCPFFGSLVRDSDRMWQGELFGVSHPLSHAEMALHQSAILPSPSELQPSASICSGKDVWFLWLLQVDPHRHRRLDNLALGGALRSQHKCHPPRLAEPPAHRHPGAATHSSGMSNNPLQYLVAGNKCMQGPGKPRHLFLPVHQCGQRARACSHA